MRLHNSYLQDAMDRYVNDHIPPGGFLTAVLSNDLKMAVAQADVFNRKMIPEIVEYCYNEIPSSCWGSPEAVEAWIEKGKQLRREQHPND